jgi:hypothetical protein
VALINREQVPLYKEYPESIHASAVTWDLSPILLGTVIELEGGGFETLTQAFGVGGRAAQWATDLSGIGAAPGVGSTMPRNIQQVYEIYCNYTPSLSSIRADLARSNPYGIWAARLFEAPSGRLRQGWLRPPDGSRGCNFIQRRWRIGLAHSHQEQLARDSRDSKK